MLKKVNLSFNMMLGLNIFVFLAGFGAFYYKVFLILPLLSIVNVILMLRKRSYFVAEYNKYNCAREENTIIPDKFLKFLYYGKENLYFTQIHACDIIPYDGLEIDKITSTLVHLSNKNHYKVYKDRYKKMKLDISQLSMSNFQEYFFNNIEEAKSIDIDDKAFQGIIKEREAKQNSLIPVKILIPLAITIFGVLVPVAILANVVSESIAVGVLFGTLIIDTIITIPITISYLKELFQYKRELEAESGSVPQFYKIYFRLAFLPGGMILCLWAVAIVMAADVWFNVWLF